MQVVFRADSSNIIGSGHLMRCKALADELIRRGANVVFVCRDYPGNWTQVLTADGLETRILDRRNLCHGPVSQSDGSHSASPVDFDQMQDADETLRALGSMGPDWLVVDHYLLDSKWEMRLRDRAVKIMVIDDVVERFHECDLILNQSVCSDSEGIYSGLVTGNVDKLLGPKFALLRREFRELRNNRRSRNGSMNRILIFFGTVDPTGETLKALVAVDMFQNSDIMTDVVVGRSSPDLREIEAMCNSSDNMRFHCPASSMAKLILEADISIGAGGVTSLERCCLGLPAIVKPIASNQFSLTACLFQAGAIAEIPSSVMTGPKDYLRQLCMIDSVRLTEMGLAASELVDGAGCARVAQRMLDS